MTLQIDSLATSANEAQSEVEIDRLDEQLVTLDATILDAIERRTELARTLAAAKGDAEVPADSTSFDALGSDGSVFSRVLARIASSTR
ncbi:hypothetical protein O1W68_19250 [Rhodococcus sp. H36-A4]|uniref:hypothetical protein n=1 Tax=Rhodococcus sp. H36-A4 TaxID=3004353 RepID=UPI0022AF008F|nr:hypothetical protein [Rhodococcus sp. H36-A4]MCZ4080086.1 hypothetical protein [Rhodococcus sp. H36-A4]